MDILRCNHCGLEGDGIHAVPHKSTCNPYKRQESYTVVQAETKPKPVAAKITSTSPTKPTKKKARK